LTIEVIKVRPRGNYLDYGSKINHNNKKEGDYE